MTKGEDYRIQATVTKECWKQLKILAVQREITLQQAVKDVLERSMSKKISKQEDTNEG